MKIEELVEIFSEDGLYTVRVENGAIVSHCRIKCLQSQQRKSGAALIDVYKRQVHSYPC